MEQRADDTARLPGRAADGAPPAAGGEGRAAEAGSPGDSYSDSAGWAATGWSQSAAADGGYGSAQAGHAYQPGAGDGSPAASGGSYSAGADRGYPAEAEAGNSYSPEPGHGYQAEAGYGQQATDPGYRVQSASGSEYPGASGEAGYGSADDQRDYGQQDYSQQDYSRRNYSGRDYSEPPYPSQVTSPDRPSGSRTGGPADWAGRLNGLREAATARLPRPQVSLPRPQVSLPRPQAAAKRTRPRRSGSKARQAHLLVSRIEPWSVMKFSFMISLVCFVILFVAVTLLYGALAGLGVFDAIQKALASVTSSQGSTGVNASHWFSASTILGYTALLGALDVVLITAFATIGSVIYNLTSHLVGGIEVTLRETE